MKTIFSRAIPALTLFFVLAANHSAMACAACWNPAGADKMNHAATVGIFAMVVIMFFMLGAVAAFGWHLAYRARHPLPDDQDLMKEDHVQPNPGTSS